MSVLSSLACALNLHAPIRRGVNWNGRVYVGECRHCGAPIQRLGRRNWRKRTSTDDQQDGSPTST